VRRLAGNIRKSSAERERSTFNSNIYSFCPRGTEVKPIRNGHSSCIFTARHEAGRILKRFVNLASRLPAFVEKNKSFPFVVLSPQCLEGEHWTDSDGLIALLDHVLKNYAIDPRRVYLTGHSMCARGSWYLAYRHPEKFAAIAPVSGNWLRMEWASRLKHMPIWAFHGEKDDIAPISLTVELVQAVKDAGNTEVRFTVLPARDHWILDQYENRSCTRGFCSTNCGTRPFRPPTNSNYDSARPWKPETIATHES